MTVIRTVNRILILGLCWLLAIPASAFGPLGIEIRIGGSPDFPSNFDFWGPSQAVDTHQVNPGVDYDFASGVHKYLYAHGHPVNRKRLAVHI
jgi:hypothetical protein